MIPYLTRAPSYAFLVHPRDVTDVDRLGGSSLLRRYSASEDEFWTRACALSPLVIGEVMSTASAVRGEIIGVLRRPEDMMGPIGKQATVDGAALAVRRGTRVIGLGALTSPVTGAGQSLLPHVPAGVTVTTGNAYTAAVVRRNVLAASAELGVGLRARVAVVGCTGSVGVPACHLLAAEGFDLVLIGRSAERARHLLGDLIGSATFAAGLDAVRETDVVVLLTSDPTAKLRPDHVRPGTIVIDCAQPSNVPAAAYPDFEGGGVAVVEGALVRIPGYLSTYDFGFADPRDTFSCLAETYMLARIGAREHSVGRPPAEQAWRLERLAERYGIAPRPFDVAPAAARARAVQDVGAASPTNQLTEASR